ncbi:MAG: NYN domain-containing protein [Chlamydiota bacterium]|nr:NYN domain-containing protein [Chlamydiota bacterium]
MRYIIDGHNYIYRIASLRRHGSKSASLLIRRLSHFSDYCHVSVVLVFDGKPFDLSDQMIFSGITIMHSGKRFSADAFIEKMIVELDNKVENISIVTADRKIRDFAAMYDIDSLSPSTFEAEMQYHVKLAKRELARRSQNRLNY